MWCRLKAQLTQTWTWVGFTHWLGWVGLSQATCLFSFQVFDFGLLWSWIRIGFQIRCEDIQVVAIASLTSTFYSCMTVAARCILCLKLACMKTNEIYILVIITRVWWVGLGRLTTWSGLGLVWIWWVGWVDKSGPMSMSVLTWRKEVTLVNT